MNPKKILPLLFVGVLMGALDISIVGPAIPAIEKGLQVAAKDITWIFSIYILFNLVGTSLFAKLSDLYGRRDIYILCLAMFAAGSLIVALSGNFETLLIGRSIQGFGSSGIFPVAAAVIGDVFPPENRGRQLGLIGAVWGLAFIIGPVIAGALLSFFTWHVLFLVNIPIALPLIYFSYRWLPTKGTAETAQLDWKGISLLGIMLGAFTYGMNHIEPNRLAASLESYKFWPYLTICVLSFFIFIYHIEKAANPVLNAGLFRSDQVRIVCLICVASGMFQSVIVFIPDFAVKAFQITAANASFMLLPFVVAMAIGSPIFGRLMDKTGSRVVILIGIALSIAGQAILGYLGENKEFFYTAGAIAGFGMSVLAGSAPRYIMLNEAKEEERALPRALLRYLPV